MHRSRERQPTDGTAVALTLWMFAETESDPIHFWQYLTLAIHHCYDAGNVAVLRSPLAILASVLDRIGHHEPAATISGFAATDFSRASYPQLNTAVAHLRDVLGDETYESLARKGKTMTTAAMVTYAFDQIDQARTKLNAVSKQTTSRHTGAFPPGWSIAHVATSQKLVS